MKNGDLERKKPGPHKPLVASSNPAATTITRKSSSFEQGLAGNPRAYLQVRNDQGISDIMLYQVMIRCPNSKNMEIIHYSH